jgi:hypothetical protein
VCASQQDTGEQPQPPESPQPHALSPPPSAAPRRSDIVLTFRPPPRRPQADDKSLRAEDKPPLPASHSPSGDDPPRQLAQAQTFADASAGVTAARFVDTSLIVIGAALFLCALATLTSTWAWSWHAGSGSIYTLWHMHGICTSAMGELAQGASGTVSSHCLWVEGTWTEAVALTAGGCILTAIGIARFLRARTPA